MYDYLYYDVETKSQLDLKKVGPYRYAADNSTEVLCVGYAINDDPVQIWEPGQKPPADVIKHINRQRRVVAFNAPFERQIHNQILGPRHSWITPRLEQYRCLMAMGNALALPGSLEGLASAMGLEEGKDKVGRRIMLQMTKPRRARKNEDPDEVHWYDDEVRTGQLHDYCSKDVSVTRELFGLLWPLIDEEQAIWEMDQRINDRGFYVDSDLLLAMRRIILDAGADINRQITAKTGGAVTTVDQVANIKTWLKDRCGVTITELNKKTIPEFLKAPIPQLAKDVLELRMAGAQAAVKKVDAFLSRRDHDGRVRGPYIYHAAGTGRWASRGAQVHNLKRLTTEEEGEIASAVDDIMTGDYKVMKTKYARPLQIIGDNIRTAICAAPGNVLIGADFSGIEARITAWLAGEERKLQVFRDYDAGKGPDPYVVAASDIFGVPPKEITKPQRQVGKGAELAFGFQGGVNAYKKFMPGTSVSPTQKQSDWDRRHGTGPAGTESKIIDPIGILTDEQIDQIKLKWRKKHPNIENYWHALGNAAKQIAIKAARGNWNIESRQVKTLWFEYTNKFMFIVLPSGRRLSYPYIGRTMRYRDQFFIEKPDDKPEGRLDTFFMDNSSGRWHRVFLYGGLICENVVQAVARDLLALAMQRIEKAGLPIVCHTHDEAVIEVSIKYAKKVAEQFSRLMTMLPPWAQANEAENIPELPLVAKTWMAHRYVK